MVKNAIINIPIFVHSYFPIFVQKNIDINTSGCDFNITGNVNNDKTDNNDAINENQNTDNNDTGNNAITFDHITNDKVQEVYDMIKISSKPYDILKYYNSDFLDNLGNKIDIVLDSSISDKSYVSQFPDNIKSSYSNKGYEVSYGYISLDSMIEKLKNLFNITITEQDIVNLNRSKFGAITDFSYIQELKGFATRLYASDYDTYYKSRVTSCIEDSDKYVVEEVSAIIRWNNGVYSASSNVTDFAESNIDFNTYEIKDEDIDKFMKLKYTFNKRDDGTCYLSNVEKVN